MIEEYWIGYSNGQLDAYIAMIKRGVKYIGTPNLLFERNSHLWKDVVYEVKKAGLSILDMDYQYAEDPSNNFGKIIFVPEKKEDAKRIIQLLFKKEKKDEVHFELGSLFGYSKEKIEEFIERLKI